jgi:hypothetical protein
MPTRLISSDYQKATMVLSDGSRLHTWKGPCPTHGRWCYDERAAYNDDVTVVMLGPEHAKFIEACDLEAVGGMAYSVAFMDAAQEQEWDDDTAAIGL